MLRKIIDRPVAVTMMTIVIIVIGLVCLRFLPISLIPDIDIPYITVQAESAGMSSREMDRSVLSHADRRIGRHQKRGLGRKGYN